MCPTATPGRTCAPRDASSRRPVVVARPADTRSRGARLFYFCTDDDDKKTTGIIINESLFDRKILWHLLFCYDSIVVGIME